MDVDSIYLTVPKDVLSSLGRMNLAVHLSFSPERTFRVGTLQEIGRDTAFSYDPAFIGIGLDLAPLRLPQKG